MRTYYGDIYIMTRVLTVIYIIFYKIIKYTAIVFIL